MKPIGTISVTTITTEHPTNRQGWLDYEAGFRFAKEKRDRMFPGTIVMIPSPDMVFNPKTITLHYSIRAHNYCVLMWGSERTEWWRRGYAAAVTVIETAMLRRTAGDVAHCMFPQLSAKWRKKA